MWAQTLLLFGLLHFVNASNLFYIYDWPESVVDVTPKAFTHHRLSMTADFLDNNGLGRVVDEKQGLYHTHQYSLFLTFMARLKESPYRTLDPEHASLFFVPYDLGMDSSTRQNDGALASTRCPHMKEAYTLLEESKYFQRKQGQDHFILHSINQMMLYYTPEKCLELYKLCFDCVKLGIDSYTEKHYRELQRLTMLSHKWVSIPFPSNYHDSRHVEHVDPSSSSLSLTASSSYASSRNYTLVYMGSSLVTASKQRMLRDMIRQQCQSSLACQLIDLKSHASTADIFTKDGGNPYSKGKLCLMPGGDFPTRKGVLDALQAGCVPITFQLVTAQRQWAWHWGSFKTAMQCTVHVPRERFMKDPEGEFLKLERLGSNSTFMAEKVNAIRQVRAQLQYRAPGGYVRIEDAPADAVDVVMQNLFELNNKK